MLKGMRYSFYAFVLWAVTLRAHAQSPDTSIKLEPVGPSTIKELTDTVLRYLWQVAIPVLTIMVIWGGYQILTAGDDSSKVTKGKETVKWAVVGAGIILIAQGMVYVVGQLFGLSESEIDALGN